MKVKRKKFKLILIFIYGIFFSGVFLTSSLIGLFSYDTSSLLRVFCFLMVLLLVYLLAILYYALKKIFSNNPEFEITDVALIFYDDPKLHKIYFKDIKECILFDWPRNPTRIRITCKRGTPYKGNLNWFQRGLLNKPKQPAELYISTEFTDMKPEKLLELIIARLPK